MNQVETFDESDQNSISDFADYLMSANDDSITIGLLEINLRKSIDCVKSLNNDDYKTNRVSQLFRVIQNLAFFCKREDMLKIILQMDFHSTFAKTIDYFLTDINLNKGNFTKVLATLCGLTFTNFEGFAIENIKYELHKKVGELLRVGNFQSIEKLNDDEFFLLYSSAVNFFMINSFHSYTKEALIGTSVKELLLSHLEQLDRMKGLRDEIKYVKLTMTTAIGNLMNDQQLDTLPISQEIVDLLMESLIELMEKSSGNEKLNDTKYYTYWTVGSCDRYVFANNRLKLMATLAVNDTIKQKFFDGDILPLLQILLQNGNPTEKESCAELLCSLCFNENVVKNLKGNEKFIKLIKETQEMATLNTTKQSCQQIIYMINQTLEKRASSAKKNKTSGHIMISYNHKYKEQCLKINEELKKRGYQTWIDLNSTITDLHDAMATAIESASIVLMCYSHEYKTSNNCRIEAQYAFKLNKTIVPVKMQSNYTPDGR